MAAPTARPAFVRNTVLNAGSQVVPIIVGVLTIPILARQLGAPRFGILTLGWVIIGYFSLFDLGLGRALTQIVAQKIAAGDHSDVGVLAWTSLWAMLWLGFTGMALLVIAVPHLVGSRLQIPPELHREALIAFSLFALSIPVVITSSGLRGILEAYQRFDLVNTIRIPLGAFMFVGPVLVLPFSKSLVPIATVLLAVRIVAWIAHMVFARRVVPSLGRTTRMDWQRLQPMLRFGSWMTVSNIVGPLMVVLDRFVIAAIASVTAVAYYTAPYEAITKLWLVPTAVTAVLFPAFAGGRDVAAGETIRLFDLGVKSVLIVLFPIVLVVVAVAGELLHLWLGPEYAAHSTRVLQLLACGVLANSFGHIAITLVQAGGRPDWSAKLHATELVPYIAALLLLIRVAGIEGAALAWVLRCAVDAVVLFWLAFRLVPRPRFSPSTWMNGFFVAGSLLTVAIPASLTVRLLLLVVLIPIFMFVTWTRTLDDVERARLLSIAGRSARTRTG